MDAIICMAGSASRLNIGLNKVFYELNGQMVFLYSLNILKKYCDNIILTIREEDIDYVKPYLNEKINHVIGGSERYHSVYNAMLKVKSSKVLIHDGARPFISENTIKEILNNSSNYDLILPYIKVKGTIYQNEPWKLLDRNNIIIAQTPQLVEKDYFIKSYNNAIKDGFKPTDDISLILKYFPNLALLKILDSENNIKITTIEDLNLARRLL